MLFGGWAAATTHSLWQTNFMQVCRTCLLFYYLDLVVPDTLDEARGGSSRTTGSLSRSPLTPRSPQLCCKPSHPSS